MSKSQGISVKRHHGCEKSLQVRSELQLRFVNWRNSSVTPPTLLTIIMLSQGKSQWILSREMIQSWSYFYS